MKRVLVLATVLVFGVSAYAQKELTAKEIYRANRDGIVQIYVNNQFSGTGFIASADGTIVTANHVVTTKQSSFRQYASDIKVLVNGRATPYPATPIAAQVPDEQVNYDTAVLKIAESRLPSLALGDWDEVDIGDELTIIPSFPGMGIPLLAGLVANKGPAQTDLGSRLVNTIIFQSPVRNGFSGAPIFSHHGHVIGIVTTKVFGISPAIDAVRQQLAASSQSSTVIIQGVNFAPTMTELINVLDQNLISGVGSGVDIGYAKKIQTEAAKGMKKEESAPTTHN
ncbi:MAG: serine protease [Acidobacteriia bacterium]|nr:serine protease [Terriglobia bacterium]